MQMDFEHVIDYSVVLKCNNQPSNWVMYKTGLYGRKRKSWKKMVGLP